MGRLLRHGWGDMTTHGANLHDTLPPCIAVVGGIDHDFLAGATGDTAGSTSRQPRFHSGTQSAEGETTARIAEK